WTKASAIVDRAQVVDELERRAKVRAPPRIGERARLNALVDDLVRTLKSGGGDDQSMAAVTGADDVHRSIHVESTADAGTTFTLELLKNRAETGQTSRQRRPRVPLPIHDQAPTCGRNRATSSRPGLSTAGGARATNGANADGAMDLDVRSRYR